MHNQFNQYMYRDNFYPFRDIITKHIQHNIKIIHILKYHKLAYRELEPKSFQHN